PKGRKRSPAGTKGNIIKSSAGLLLDCFRKVAQRHPTIEPAEVIVDACAMQMGKSATRLDVIMTENLYGAILSDLGAGLVGGLGIVPAAITREDPPVFEAVHGSAP